MSLFNKISSFYGGDSLLKADFIQICLIASAVTRSIVSNESIECSYFDGYISRKKSFRPESKLDAIVCLSRLSAVLETRLSTLTEKDVQMLELWEKTQASIGGSPNA